MPEIIASTLGARITLELRKRDLTITEFLQQLNERFGTRVKIPGYAHILRVCKGETYPGPNLLPVLCDALEIDLTEAKRMLSVDKGINSGATELVTGKDRQLLEFEEIWRQLSQSHRDELSMLARFKLGVKGID